jgi:hypothetical protein
MKKLLTLVGVLVLTVGCSASLNDRAKTAILLANDAQAAAAATYEDAKNLESTASAACRDAALKKSVPIPNVTTPADWPAAKQTCADLGAPIPFDPFLLKSIAGPINALYDGVRQANTIRVSFEGATISADVLTSTLLKLANLFVEVEADLVIAGVSVPKGVDSAATTLKQIGVGK